MVALRRLPDRSIDDHTHAVDMESQRRATRRRPMKSIGHALRRFAVVSEIDTRRAQRVTQKLREMRHCSKWCREMRNEVIRATNATRSSVRSNHKRRWHMRRIQC
jgi:hypothetical protein